MSETIREGYRTAKKEHTCDYCRGRINPGERYLYSVILGDELHYWKSHDRCAAIADALYAYIDPPDYGIGSDEFREGCAAFCEEFLCKTCLSYQEGGCSENRKPCLDKIEETLKEKWLVRDPVERWKFNLIERRQQLESTDL